MASGIVLPLEMAVLLCAGCMLAGGWLGHHRQARRSHRSGDPLRELLKPDNFGRALDLALHRDARRQASHALLRARIDQFAARYHGLDAESREQMREHVAAVMRLGLRRHDRITLSGSDDVTILVSGADERAAMRIADRLRRSLARLRLPHLGKDAQLTVSFGIAAERFGENFEGLERRAHRALDAAVAQGADQVVPASEIEDIPLLPAPAATLLAAGGSAASAV